MIRILQLWRDQRGVAAVEFALAIPIIATVIIGGMNFGIYYMSKNSVDYAVDEAARYAAIYPTPTTTEIEKRFNDRLTRSFEQDRLKIEVVAGNSGSLNYVDVKANASVDIDLAFMSFGAVPITSERRVYVEP